ncbi:MAG: ATP-binding protein [Myxococcales bacterium]|nr:ATP-binding protein [Myxococcales bacterium]
MAARRILRFFGSRGDLLAAESPSLVVYDGSGQVRFRTEVEGLSDVVAVDDELWVVSLHKLTRLSARDGSVIAIEPIEYLDPAGRFLQSSTARQLPVWHASEPVLLRANPARTEIPGPGGKLILPITDGRWILWQGGQLRLWRTIGEAWRTTIGEPGGTVVDAQLVLDGRLFVFVVQRAAPRPNEPSDADLRLMVVAVNDGAPTTQMRLRGVSQLAIAARRGIALARSGERLSVLDLRFGRWIRDLVLPAGVVEIAVDEGLQRIALATTDGLELVHPDALASQVQDAADPPTSPVETVDPSGASTLLEGADAREPSGGELNGHAGATLTATAVAPDEPLPEAPLVRLDPVSVFVSATPKEIAQALELRLQLISARVGVAISEAWDNGRLSKPDPARPPFADEVAGLLRLATGRAPEELGSSVARLRATEQLVASAEEARAGRLTPLDVLAHDFQLSRVAVAMLFAMVAPRLRGDLTRLYGILSNDPGRPLIDEHLLGQLLGSALAPEISRELDGDRPLRKLGLVRAGGGERPFVALTVDPLVVRYIANLSQEGEPDLHLKVRQVDRDLDELQLPRKLIVQAMRFLGSPREDEPVRIVVRGRTGSGRHTLLTSLAARAGRSLGIIDLSMVPREPGRLAQTLETVLRRALLRGLIPCVDGLELENSEDPDTKVQLASVLRMHPGPIAIRLPGEVPIPLDPGYLLIDIPLRNEQERGESWMVALEHHRIDLPDGSELAARYRVGPGIIERVCGEIARRPDRPTDPAAVVRELDEAVRQHLENRLGATANRVTRLSSWADIVLPEDILDSLLELTARVRHRKKVYEQWGFDRSMTTSRGITALFSGSPGTGKTMVAGVIARDLGLDLYRVDVSRITSKWIGETEKNLGSLFDAAEDGQVMLLFDEADSLFAKRTEVKSSVDRYANMEVNYLLQRLDSFEGIAILTTNFGTSIDPAFKRRLTYRVTFPFPDEEMREQLWRSLLPPEVPVVGQLDFAALAQRFRLSGGYIRNATLRAAFLAAEEGSSLTHAHLERAIRMEYRELGKLAESGTLE